MRIAILLLFAVSAAAFRLYSLDCSFGTDALASLVEADRTSVDSLIRYFGLYELRNFSESSIPRLAHHLEVTMPGYYVLLAGLRACGMQSDASLRLWSAALFGVLLVPGMYLLGRRFIAPAAGAMLAVLTLFSPLLQYYSTYIRFYSLNVTLAALCFFYFLSCTQRAKDHKRLGFSRILGISVLLWLPLFVHISSLLMVAVCCYLLLFFILPHLGRGERSLVVGLSGVTAIPFVGNALLHLYARFLDGGAVDNVMAKSALSFIGGIYFNFNGLVLLGIAVYLVAFRPSRERFLKFYLPFVLCFAALFFAATIRSDLFRPDYVSSLLPVTYFLFCDSVYQLSNRLSEVREQTTLRWMLLGAAIFYSLPSFVSNLAIDQDRFDYGAVAKEIKERTADNSSVLVYAMGQDRFEKYGFDVKKFTFANLHQWNEIDEQPFDRVFVVLGWRREGFDKGFALVTRKNISNQASIFADSRLVTFTGKARIDLRDNFMFLFERVERNH